MTIRYVAIAFAALMLLAGFSHAQPAAASRDDSFETFDLTSVEGGVFYLMCRNYEERPDDILECKMPSIWQEDNAIKGLQSSAYAVSGKAYDRDRPLLP